MKAKQGKKTEAQFKKLSKKQLQDLIERRTQLTMVQFGELCNDNLHTLSPHIEAAKVTLAWRKRHQAVLDAQGEMKRSADDKIRRDAERGEVVADLRTQFEAIINSPDAKKWNVPFHELLTDVQVGICRSLPQRREIEITVATGRTVNVQQTGTKWGNRR